MRAQTGAADLLFCDGLVYVRGWRPSDLREAFRSYRTQTRIDKHHRFFTDLEHGVELPAAPRP
jgi:hypothetical protein